MKEGVTHRDESFIDVEVEDRCPLNWIAEHYQKFAGKVVAIDSTFFKFILHHAVRKKAYVDETTGALRVFAFFAPGVTKDGVPFPSSEIYVDVFGKGRLGDETNWYILSKIVADDIPDYGFVNSPDNTEVLYLSAHEKKEYHDIDDWMEKKSKLSPRRR